MTRSRVKGELEGGGGELRNSKVKLMRVGGGGGGGWYERIAVTG